MEKRKLTDGTVSLTGLKVKAVRTVEHHTFRHGTEGVLTYKPFGNDGSKYNTNELVYGLMIIAAYDMLEVGKVFVTGDYTASELAGTNGYIHAYLENGNEDYVDYDYINIETKTFRCRFTTRSIFEQIAEWEGVMGLTAKKCHKFRCTTTEVRSGSIAKPYKRCHGYHPRTVSWTAENARIGKKFKVIGRMAQSLSSEGMKKALSLLTAVKSVEKLYGHEMADIASRLMNRWHWEQYPRQQVVYQTLVGGKLVEKKYPEDIDPTPVVFSASDFKDAPGCYKVVDEDYTKEMLHRFREFMNANVCPSWIGKDNSVQLKNQQAAPKKWQGRLKVCRVFGSLDAYCKCITWYAEVCTTKGRWDSMNRTVGTFEAWVDDKPKPAKKPKAKSQEPKAIKVKGTDYTVKSDGRTETFGSYIPGAMAEESKPDTMTLAEQLRQALLKRLAA